MPGAHQPRRNAHERVVEQDGAAQAHAGDEVASDALQQIVAATASSLARPEDVDPALHGIMKEVAQRFAGQPITLDPVGSALIEAVLRAQFPLLAARPKVLAQTSRQVAASLLNDPAARLRVEHLWARLAEDSE